MFATLNLQIASLSTALDGAVDLSGMPADGRPASGDSPLPFSALLALRTDLPVQQPAASGDFLPDDGKGLPPFGPPKLAEDLRQVPEIETPALPVLTTRQGEEATESPDPELTLALAIPYSAPEAMTTPAPPAVLLPAEKLPSGPTHRAELTPAPPAPATRVSSADNGPPMAIEPELLLARTNQTLNAVTPGTTTAAPELPVLQPLAENLLRDKTLQPAPQNLKPMVVSPDNGTIKLADAPQEVLPPVVGRTIAALETVQRPDTRVASTSSAHSVTPTHLPTTISQFSNEASLSRSDMLTETINTPVRDAAWGDKLGERLLMLSGNQTKTAEIKLTPADLGPLRVRVTIEEGAAHVQFHAQHAVTREAIEQALPRLREMLAESGLSLGQADVSEQGVADGKADREFTSGSNTAASGEQPDDAIEADLSERRKTVARNNLLDTFA